MRSHRADPRVQGFVHSLLEPALRMKESRTISPFTNAAGPSESWLAPSPASLRRRRLAQSPGCGLLLAERIAEEHGSAEHLPGRKQGREEES